MKVKKNICSLITALSLSSSFFSPISANAYDKNDNYVTDKIVASITRPAVFVLAEENVSCAANAFFEQPRGCKDNATSAMDIWSGSGTVLADKKGVKYVLTNSHVLPEKNFLAHVHGVKREFIKTAVYKRDPYRDLALLKINAEDNSKIAPASEHCYGIDYSLGDHVAGIAYTMLRLSYVQGTVHSISDEKMVNIEAPFIEGNSGGTLYAFDHGTPVGIGLMTLNNLYDKENLSAVVSTNVISEFLKGTPVEHYICKKEVEKSEKESTGK